MGGAGSGAPHPGATRMNGGRPPWLADLVHQVGDAVAAFDASGTIVYANRAADRVLGGDAGQVIGTNAFDLVHPDDLSRAVTTMAGIDRGARPLPGLIRLRRLDGTWRHFELSPAPIELPAPPDGPGRVTSVVIRETVLQDAHWSFLTALSGGAPLHDCFTALADGLSTPSDGPMGITYEDGSRRRHAGPLPPALAGIGEGGDLDTTPGTPWAMAVRTGRLQAVPIEEIPEPWRSLGRAEGGAACVVVPVLDPSAGAPALIVQWPPVEAMAELLAEALAIRPHQAVTLALDRRDAQQRLEHLAHHDGLTGLVNRGRFFVRLAELAAERRPYGVLYVDLDRFKAINDTLGHVIGDHALVVCARRLQRLVRPGDTLARLGGDEFALACPDVDPDALRLRAAGIVRALAHPLRIADHIVDGGASVGAARTEGHHPPDAVVAAADGALYAAKRAGRSTWRAADEILPAPRPAADPASWLEVDVEREGAGEPA